MPDAIRYLRKSRVESPADAENSRRRQLEATRRWAENNGYTLVGTYVDMEGVSSGGSIDRAQWQDALAHLERLDAGDAIVAEMLDRFSRDLEYLMRFVRRCHDAGIRFVTAREGEVLPPNQDPEGWVRFLIGGTMAEYWRHKSSQNISNTLRDKQAAGKFVGAPPFGTKRTDDGLLVPHPDEVDALRRCYQLYVEGYGYATAARQLNEEGWQYRGTGGWRDWKRTDVKRTLNQYATYAGHVVRGNAWRGDGRVILEDAWEPILSARLIRDAHTEQVRRRDKYAGSSGPGPGPNWHVYLLTGILYCNQCGQKLRGQLNNGHRYYRHKLATCDAENYGVRTETLDEQVYALLRDVDWSRVEAVIRAQAEAMLAVYGPDRSELADRLAALEAKRDRLEAVMLDGVLDGTVEPQTMRTRLRQLDDDIARLRKQATRDVPGVDELVRVATQVADLRHMDKRQRKLAVRDLFARIDVDMTTFDLTYHLDSEIAPYVMPFFA